MPEFVFTIRRTTTATWPFKIEAPSQEAAEQWIDEHIVHGDSTDEVNERLDRSDALDEVADDLRDIWLAGTEGRLAEDRLATGIFVDPDDFEVEEDDE